MDGGAEVSTSSLTPKLSMTQEALLTEKMGFSHLGEAKEDGQRG